MHKPGRTVSIGVVQSIRWRHAWSSDVSTISLLKKIKPILESYIKENNVSLVVDKKYILGGGAKTDITEIIVEKLNKDLPSLNLN